MKENPMQAQGALTGSGWRGGEDFFSLHIVSCFFLRQAPWSKLCLTDIELLGQDPSAAKKMHGWVGWVSGTKKGGAT